MMSRTCLFTADKYTLGLVANVPAAPELSSGDNANSSEDPPQLRCI